MAARSRGFESAAYMSGMTKDKKVSNTIHEDVSDDDHVVFHKATDNKPTLVYRPRARTRDELTSTVATSSSLPDPATTQLSRAAPPPGPDGDEADYSPDSQKLTED